MGLCKTFKFGAKYYRTTAANFIFENMHIRQRISKYFFLKCCKSLPYSIDDFTKLLYLLQN